MIISILGYLVLLQAAPQAVPVVVAVPAELSKPFSTILRQHALLAPETGRVLLPELKGLHEAKSPAWVVEFRWTDKGTTHSGVATFLNMPAMMKDLPPSGKKEAEKEIKLRDGDWGLYRLSADKTLEGWIQEAKRTARKGNEIAAEADVRTVISAEATFQAVSGSYGELSCLAEPSVCLPGSKEKALIDLSTTAAPERAGYRQTFHAGPRVATKGAGPSRLLRTWAFTATPIDPDGGQRAFCGDSTGKICAVADGSMPTIIGGTCPKSCTPVP